MSTQMKSIAFAAALSALAAGAVHAQSAGLSAIAASADPVTQSQSVPYGDLNLSSAAGMKTLTARINSAAKSVCGPAPEHGESRTPYQACIKSATDGAMIQVARASEASRLALNSPRRHGG